MVSESEIQTIQGTGSAIIRSLLCLGRSLRTNFTFSCTCCWLLCSSSAYFTPCQNQMGAEIHQWSSMIGLKFIVIGLIDRRKFRNQTSDNMETWKAEKKRKEHKRDREKTRRKTMQACEVLGKFRNIAFFSWFVGQEEIEKVYSVVARSQCEPKM